jgi:hypothetical protein
MLCGPIFITEDVVLRTSNIALNIESEQSLSTMSQTPRTCSSTEELPTSYSPEPINSTQFVPDAFTSRGVRDPLTGPTSPRVMVVHSLPQNCRHDYIARASLCIPLASC